MDGKQMIEYYKNEIKKNPKLGESIWVDCDFEFDNDTDVKRDILICGEESNYEIFPFGRKGDGSNYALLNGEQVAFISSEGECGIVARNVKEFFNIILTCKYITYYFERGVFDNIDNFKERFNMANNEAENLEIIASFIKSQDFETDVNKIYEMFLQGIITEPSLILQANSEEYEPWDDVFDTSQEYIEELRKKQDNNITLKGLK